MRADGGGPSPAPDIQRPEAAAGGFSSVDGTVEFYSRVQALLPTRGTVLDLGAGRGKWQEDSCAWRRDLCDLRGNRRLVVGVDIDRAVTDNDGVDAAVLLGADGSLPFESGSIALVLADWVFEHLADPAPLAAELARVLRPGGWLCARTPNKWGYVAIGARLVPNRLHVRLLGGLQPRRAERDVFPTFYRVNTRAALRHALPEELWMDCTYGHNPDPDYVGRSVTAYRALVAWQRLAPQFVATTLHAFLQRRDTARSSAVRHSSSDADHVSGNGRPSS